MFFKASYLVSRLLPSKSCSTEELVPAAGTGLQHVLPHPREFSSLQAGLFAPGLILTSGVGSARGKEKCQ